MNLAVLPGDDIGPEIVEATLRVLEKADHLFGLGLSFQMLEVGMAAHRRTGTTLPDETFEQAKRADGIILGPAGVTAYPPAADGGLNVPGTIRKRLDLYANIRPARSRTYLPRAVAGLDCLFVRENTEGFYADRSMFHGSGEFMPTADCALSVRRITTQASRRVAKLAFAYAGRRRRAVTMVGKRHVLQTTDGLFMREAESEAALYPHVVLNEMDVDAVAAELYTHPERFDVILTTNMFGDILSNEALALSGGLGLACSLNLGDRHAAANAGHGSAPDIAGKGIANPIGMILSSAMLLDWLGDQHSRPEYCRAAGSIEAAADVALQSAEHRTPDLGGRGGTRSLSDAICRALGEPSTDLDVAGGS
jgi:isocitrate/isopropylmalate dehydrogenase